MVKKILSLLTVAALTLSLASCATTPAPQSGAAAQSSTTASQPATASDTPAEGGVYKAGSYEATVPAMKGDMTVKVTVDATAITAVEIVKHEDTRTISDSAISLIPGQIVEKQSLAIDTVTGATVTSRAILAGATKALEQAGGNMEALTKAPEATPLVAGADEQVDILIVGSGGSGLTAAIEATRDNSGLKVMVIEKLAYVGGSTRVAGGAIWMRGTEYNKMEGGVDFDVDYLAQFMEQRSDTQLNRPLLKKIAEISPDTINYLMENGMPLDTTKPLLGHPDSKLFLFYPADSSAGKGGDKVADFLESLAVKNGVDIRLNTQANSLIMADGAVTGVAVQNKLNTYNITAKRVILATGGFTRNENMIKELAPGFTNNIPFTGAGSTGDGITMTKDLDTVIVGTGMMGLKTLNYNLGYYGTIGSLCNHPSVFFNKEGVRFANEKVFYSEITYPLNEQTDKIAYGVVDSTSEKVADLETAVAMGLVFKADTLEGIADLTGMNKEAFLASVEEYNKTKESGKDDPLFGVANDQMVAVTQAPFYAVPIRPGFIGSIPGLKVTENTEVVNSKDEVIKNLYACGELTFGNVFSKWYPASGSGVGFAVYTGAVCGNSVKASLTAK